MNSFFLGWEAKNHQRRGHPLCHVHFGIRQLRGASQGLAICVSVFLIKFLYFMAIFIFLMLNFVYYWMILNRWYTFFYKTIVSIYVPIFLCRVFFVGTVPGTYCWIPAFIDVFFSLFWLNASFIMLLIFFFRSTCRSIGRRWRESDR